VNRQVERSEHPDHRAELVREALDAVLGQSVQPIEAGSGE
jgi:hypothetical protein